MADNVNVRDAAGEVVAMQTKDNTSVHTAVHALADPTGANLAEVDASGQVSVLDGNSDDALAATRPVLRGARGALRPISLPV